MSIDATPTPSEADVAAYAELLNQEYESADIKVSVKPNGDMLVTGTDVDGNPIDPTTLVINSTVLAQLRLAAGAPELLPATYPPLSAIDFREMHSYLDSSILTVMSELVMLLELDLSKLVREKETEFGVDMLKMMQDNVNNLFESKIESADLRYQAAIINAEAKVAGGIMAITFGSISAVGGIAGAGLSAAGSSGLQALSKTLTALQGLSEVGRGGSSVIEGQAAQEAALKQLNSELQAAQDGLFEFAKELAQTGRQQASKAVDDFAQQFQKAVDKYERLTGQVAQNFRLGN